jgi:flagellar motor switch protein FliG
MTHVPRNLRKAAILLSSLDPPQAEALLGQLSAEQADTLRQALATLGDLDRTEQCEVIEEFVRVGPLVPGSDHSGIELDAPLPKSLSALAQASLGAGKRDVFHSLQEADEQDLASLLENEHPQTIAIVVAGLPAIKAAKVLAGLRGELQADVARRLVGLEATDPEILREVEQVLEARLRAQAPDSSEQPPGIAALAEILSAADGATRDRILANLAHHDRQLAERLEPPRASAVSFCDLETWDDASLAAVLHAADSELVRLALVDAAPALVERVLRLVEPPASAMLRQALCNLGPTRLADVEEAQRQLAVLAGNLAQRGQVSPVERHRLSIAA